MQSTERVTITKFGKIVEEAPVGARSTIVSDGILTQKVLKDSTAVATIVIFPLDVAGAVNWKVTLSFGEASVCVTASFGVSHCKNLEFCINAKPGILVPSWFLAWIKNPLNWFVAVLDKFTVITSPPAYIVLSKVIWNGGALVWALFPECCGIILLHAPFNAPCDVPCTYEQHNNNKRMCRHDTCIVLQQC